MIEWPTVPLWLIFALSLVCMFGAVELGRWAGTRADARTSQTIPMLVGAVLGLLALMIGFTFSVALSRFEARLDAVLEEANAIGTTALRARLLPQPQASESLKLLREYAQLRVDITTAVPTLEEAKAALDRSNAIQEALWQGAKAIAAKDNAMVPTGLYIQTLNEMIDDQEKRLTAFRNRVPTIVVLVLYAIAILAAGFTGYSGSTDTRHARISSYLVALIVASVILLIQDLDRPGVGFIKISQQPMIDAVKSLAGY